MTLKDELSSAAKCPACGKTFRVTCRRDEWGYAWGKRMCCSYSCMQAMAHPKRQQPEKRGRKKGERHPRYPAALKEEILAFYRQGYRICQIATAYGLPKTSVGAIIRRSKGAKE